MSSPRPARLDARSLRDLVLDAGSWKSWDAPVPPREVDDAYARELLAAAEKTRQDESIITGEGRLRGRRVAVVAGEFGFLAGSIGVAAAERLIAAVERATEEGLPLLAAPGVSMRVTSGSRSSSARCIPRRASRSAAGPSGADMLCPRRS